MRKLKFKSSLLGLMKILLALVLAWVITYLYFDKELLMGVFFFVILYGGSRKTKVLSKEKAAFLTKIALLLALLGGILIVIGKKLLYNDMVVILGAMLFTLIVPVIVKTGIDIIHKKVCNTKMKEG